MEQSSVIDLNMSMPNQPSQPRIATHSIGEGLDFACNLLSKSLEHTADIKPDAAPLLLRTLAQYISFRYAGEDGLALEHLAALANDLGQSEVVRWDQFWEQMDWLCERMQVSKLSRK